jgi:hypothetical protein
MAFRFGHCLDSGRLPAANRLRGYFCPRYNAPIASFCGFLAMLPVQLVGSAVWNFIAKRSLDQRPSGSELRSPSPLIAERG